MNAITHPAEFETETALAGAGKLAELIDAEREAHTRHESNCEQSIRLGRQQGIWEIEQEWELIRLDELLFHPIEDREPLLRHIDNCEHSPLAWFREVGRPLAPKAREALAAADARMRAHADEIGLTGADEACDRSHAVVQPLREAILRYPAITPAEVAAKGEWLKERYLASDLEFEDYEGRLLLESFVGAAAMPA